MNSSEIPNSWNFLINKNEMRTIKFEYGFKSINGIVKKVYHLHEIPDIKNKCDVWNMLPIVYVRQFTGLQDKTGKEIFEGDILHRHLNVYFAVRWNNNTWEAYPKFDNQGIYLSASQFIECKIIGNVHENKN